MAKSYIAGILKHAPELTSVTNQWVNSYKRLVPGYEAPVYVSWARRNRSAMVRVPMYKPGKEGRNRIEFRSPDPACNPYLAFAVMLAAGMKGVEEGYKLADPIEEDIYELSAERREEMGITELPGSLIEADPADRAIRAGARGPGRSHFQQVHRKQENRMGYVPNACIPVRNWISTCQSSSRRDTCKGIERENRAPRDQ